jgi:SH3-like domain-containing protein
VIYSNQTVLKCTRAPLGQPASNRLRRYAHVTAWLALVFVVASASAVRAQTASRDVDLLADPGARAVATVKSGAPVTVGDTRGDYTQVTVDGWLAAPLLGPPRDSFAITVSGNGARLRASASPHAAVIAELRGGMGLQEIARQGAWVRVARTGWIRTRLSSSASPTLVVGATPAVPQQTRSAPADSVSDTSHADDGALPLTPAVQTALSTSPDGERIGLIQPGARAIVTGRDRGWVRVRVDGWAREGDFVVADTALRGSLSAADLRADPDGTKGRLVHWDVQVLAHQVADPLRKGLVNQEPYLLAQGPGRENALLYLAISPALAATAREIQDMTMVTITARVRSGKSEPVGVPVLDLLSIVRR